MTIPAMMDTYAARLASFNSTHSAVKKGFKAPKWPHRRLSPPQLARAGFFYQPTTTSPDNVTCYLCESSLDGWEEDDDPTQEHMTHAPSCGWAHMVAIEQAIENGIRDLDDPTGEVQLNARLQTFGSRWPHENKRGWTCKVTRLAESGWHYCPTPESDDFVKCAYCQLSVDGWEPKDDPHEEHLRRSSDCLFFRLGHGSTASKPNKAKKKRASKAPRPSTQSVVSVVLEADSLMSAGNEDGSTLTVAEPTRPIKATKGGKKATKGKKKGAASTTKKAGLRQDESQLASSFLEPEDDDFEVKVPQPKKTRRGKKRTSAEMEDAAVQPDQGSPGEDEQNEQPPPKKRRGTKARAASTTAKSQEDTLQEATLSNDLNSISQDTHMTDAEDQTQDSMPPPKKQARGRKPKASTASRKASTASVASKASLRAGLPEDEEIEAALEEDLDRPLTDDGTDGEDEAAKARKTRKPVKSGKGVIMKKAASVALNRRTTRASTATIEDSSVNIYPTLLPETTMPEPESVNSSMVSLAPPKQRKQTARKASAKQAPSASYIAAVGDQDQRDITEVPAANTRPAKARQASRKAAARVGNGSDASTFNDNINTVASNTIPSTIDVGVLDDDVEVQEHEGEVEDSKKAPAKHGRKKNAATTKKSKTNKDEENDEALQEHPTQTEDPESVRADEHNLVQDAVQAENVVVITEPKQPKKQVSKPSKATNTKQKKGGKKLESLTVVVAPAEEAVAAESLPDPQLPSSPPLASGHSTPAKVMSPVSQSSDAENQPPSSRPSQSRPALSILSPSRHNEVRVPLANITPYASPSKTKTGFSKLQTTTPWTAVDIERVFQNTPTEGNAAAAAFGGDGIGDLSSPEKKMNVEQWIRSKAERAEEKLKAECERLVGRFEGEGMRAMKVLEGVECID